MTTQNQPSQLSSSKSHPSPSVPQRTYKVVLYPATEVPKTYTATGLYVSGSGLVEFTSSAGEEIKTNLPYLITEIAQ